MNSENSIYSNIRSRIRSCMGWSGHCAVYTLIIAICTVIFVTCMILSVYFTYKGSKDKIVIVMIIGAALLYILSFTSNIYTVCHCKPISKPSRNSNSSNQMNRTTSSLNSSSIAPPPDITCVPLHVREFPRKTPPPPYEVQVSGMSRILLPGTSRTSESLTREQEINEAARKLIQKIYEEIRRPGQQVSQSHGEVQSVQQVVQLPKSPVRQQNPMLRLGSPQNLVVQRQQIDVRGTPAQRQPPVDSRTNRIIPQKAAIHSNSTQFDLTRKVIGSERCIAGPPQVFPQNEDFLENSRQRKLKKPPKVRKMKSNIKRSTTPVVHDDRNSENQAYEEIEVLKTSQSTNSSKATYDSIECYSLGGEFENGSEQASSVYSAASEPITSELNIKFQNPGVKIRRHLSAPSTRKFRHLGQSPETVLDAIATGYELTPDEWMVAWKLGHKGVAPRERAKILGVSLHKDSRDGSD